MSSNMFRNSVISAVASFGAVALLVSADNEINMPESRCELKEGNGSFVMYNNTRSYAPSHVSASLTLEPESDFSFSSSAVLKGTTGEGYSLTVIKDTDGTGECRVKKGGNHLDPVTVYPLNVPS